eukprot:CAMPEP_0171187064 /NCGR_PEP_ID=MMETSP0790-20130122/17129_1 /TAXON_ID=2925 /ORGANISM="Alexandrium catenella, Strain OF101" /LENGTH=322 /DNA_ID=CAMNT_0011652115 /DNA_START=66 /DNA_END=1034 /DNA_ORIENTATION=+
MGAEASCCTLTHDADEKRLEEWKMCGAIDECIVTAMADEQPSKAWLPMPVAALKVLDKDRIDPWTREVIEHSPYNGILGSMVGVSPTQAPSGYLAQTVGRDVITSDGKDGHMLLSSEANEARIASEGTPRNRSRGSSKNGPPGSARRKQTSEGEPTPRLVTPRRRGPAPPVPPSASLLGRQEEVAADPEAPLLSPQPPALAEEPPPHEGLREPSSRDALIPGGTDPPPPLPPLSPTALAQEARKDADGNEELGAKRRDDEDRSPEPEVAGLEDLLDLDGARVAVAAAKAPDGSSGKELGAKSVDDAPWSPEPEVAGLEAIVR